jgi:hypothetical protein
MIYYVESYLKEKMKEVNEMPRFNYEMMDCARNNIAWILDISKKYNIELEDINKLVYLYKKSGQILENNSPTENQQRNKTTDGSIDPKIYK